MSLLGIGYLLWCVFRLGPIAWNLNQRFVAWCILCEFITVWVCKFWEFWDLLILSQPLWTYVVQSWTEQVHTFTNMVKDLQKFCHILIYLTTIQTGTVVLYVRQHVQHKSEQQCYFRMLLTCQVFYLSIKLHTLYYMLCFLSIPYSSLLYCVYRLRWGNLFRICW